MRLAALALLSLIVPATSAAAPAELSGFAFDLDGPDGDDIVLVRSRSAEPLPLGDVWLEDGEGAIAFPERAVLGPGDEVTVAVRAEAYTDATGRLPDYAVQGMDAEHTMRIADSGFALSQSGDEVRLVRDSVLVDRVVYGNAPDDGDGWRGAPVNISGPKSLRWFPRLDRTDDDDASDWNGLRRRVLGADEFEPFFDRNATQVIGYTAPESSRALVTRAIFRGDQHLRINVYEWRDLGLLDTLREWRGRFPEAQLDVLMEPGPVGQSAEERDERAHVIERLRELGARVRFSSADRYPYNHAKYIVSDNNSLLIQSENFVPGGIPADGRSGNRGFGIVLASPVLAGHLARVFDEDFRVEAHGATEAPEETPRWPAPLAPTEPTQRGETSFSTEFHEAWLIAAPHAPDPATDPVLQRIENATKRIRVAHLSLPPTWTDTAGQTVPNPYFEALRAAARRGVLVQILLDGHFIDGDPGTVDNLDTLEAVAADPGAGAIAVRLQRGERVLHAKTLLIDDEWALVGSMNGNGNSVLHNREISLLLREPQATLLFQRVFDADWEDAAGPGGIPAPGLLGTAAVVAAVLAVRRR